MQVILMQVILMLGAVTDFQVEPIKLNGIIQFSYVVQVDELTKNDAY
jgi:hypothetical protein